MLDRIITNARLVDPARANITPGAVGISSGRIAAIYPAGANIPPCRHVLDARNQMLAPGFIDAHAHLDGSRDSGRRSLLQGITTSFGGNCGMSPSDIGAFYRAQENGYFVNQAEFIGHSFSLRRAVGLMDPYAAASVHEIAKMCELAEMAMCAGAWGVSFGLDYAIGCSFAEIEALARVTAKYGGICPVHTRLYTPRDMYSLTEAVRIAAETGVRVQISHLVYQYPRADLLAQAFELIDYARARGCKLSVDSGMYTAFATEIGTVTFDRDIIDLAGWRLSNMRVATGAHKGEALTDALYEYLRACAPETAIVCYTGEDGAVERALLPEYVMPSTDAGAYEPGEGHPQAAASFPDFFRRMVREAGLLSWPEAMRRASLLPAETMGLVNKGRLEVGADADLVLFDPDRIAGCAEFPDRGAPDAPPAGISCVLIAGEIAARNGEVTADDLGRPLRFEGRCTLTDARLGNLKG